MPKQRKKPTIPKAEIARRLGWSRQRLQKYLTGKIQNCPIEIAVAIEKASDRQYRAKDICPKFRKVVKEAIGMI
jgi:hypothetical protein